MKPVLIYKITNQKNNRSYIGQTNNLDRRLAEHRASSKAYISKSIRKNGFSNFSITILQENLTLDQANDLEQHYISLFKSIFPSGYNLNTGGKRYQMLPCIAKKISRSLTGRLFSDEHKNRISISAKQRLSDPRNNPRYGIKHSKEAIKQNLFSQKTRKQIICINTGIYYNSLRQASKLTGINRESIGLASQNKLDREGYPRNTAGGMKWKMA